MIPDPGVVERIRRLPDRPGIYIFKGARGRPLYVGKAKSLRKRGASYLGEQQEPRLTAMLREAVEVDFVVTDTEAEALLLENNWIKRRRPRFNILLRDDKTYPYLKLTTQEAYPRVAFTRRIRSDGAEYFGPFLPGGLARKAIKLVQKLFQLRVCRIEIDGSLPRPCLYYDMKRCLGPCVRGLTTEGIYRQAVEEARLFLSGRSEELIRRVRGEMQAASERTEFEEAARLRDLMSEIEAVSQRRKLSSMRGEDVDIYGVKVAGGRAAVTALVMRQGQVLDRRELFWEGREEVSPAAALGELLPQIYDRTSFIPREVHLPVVVDGDLALAAWLSDRRGSRVYLRYPARGPKAQRVELAMRNAELAFRRRFRGAGEAPDGAESLGLALELPEAPRRIEGFDVSTLQGGQTVASLVVWEQGRLRKSDYRTFNISSLAGQDDLAAIGQAVERRYRRVLEEVGDMPDLILIDGGLGQLNAALQALAGLGVEETPVAALAKRAEEIYLPQRPEPLRLERSHEGLKLVQRIRDEAHRFALSRHRRRRSADLLASGFDSLSGIGPKRRRLLQRRFGNLQGVSEASLEEVQELLGPVLGRRVWEQARSAEAVDGGEATAGAGKR